MSIQRHADKQVKADMVFMASECYRMINDPKNAELWYKRGCQVSFLPEAQYRLAESNKKLGRYPQSYRRVSEVPAACSRRPRTEQQIRSCELAMEWQASPDAYVVEEPAEANTGDSDFSAAYGRDDYGLVWFTSSRDDAKETRSTEPQARVYRYF
ncbi:MAG: hypothetical protein R2756_13550 [Bacteroidales bacterium]